jgi:hypothetical protein
MSGRANPYPDGRFEIPADGVALYFAIYDRYAQVDQGAIVDNKRLSRALQVAQLVPQQSDNRRGWNRPVQTNVSVPVCKKLTKSDLRSQQKVDMNNLKKTIRETMH